MKVLAKLKKEPGLWLSTAERPVCGDNDVIIHIKKTAICGTDLHIYKWDQWAQGIIPVPMHVGHEFVGEIAEIGSHVKHLKVGDRVSGEGHVVCGYCRNCRGGRQHLCGNTLGTGVNIPGAFAEYLVLPAQNAFKLPEAIPDNIAAILDPLGNAVHTALSFDLVGEDVLITGAGPVGLMAVAVARHVGARHIVVTDINPYRLKLAETLGASRALNVQNCASDADAIDMLKQTMTELGMEVGFDVGLEMSGQQQAISSMIDTMTYGGKMALLGVTSRDNLQIHWNKIVWRGLFLKGIYGREMYETWYKMISLLQSGLNINPLITHEFPVDDYLKGFELMESGQCGKVILNWRAS